MRALLLPLLTLTACSGGELACGPGTHEQDGLCVSDAPADTDTDTDTDSDTDTDADSDTDTDTDTDTDPTWTVCADGTAPYTDIQDAIDDAEDGAVVTVCEGTYDYVEISRLDVTLIGAGTDLSTIDGGTHTALTVDDSTFAIEGFTLLGEPRDAGTAGGLWLIDSVATVENVRFAGAEASVNNYMAQQEGTDGTWEGVVFEDNAMSGFAAWSGGSVVMRHSVFRNNGSASSGAMLILGNSLDEYELSNNLFYGNTVPSGGDGASLYAVSGVAWAYNNVWYGNDHGGSQYLVNPQSGVLFENNIVAHTTGGGIMAYEPVNGISYNDSFGNSGDDWATNHGDTAPATNLTTDARFVDPENGDFHLMSGFSPCENAGDPLSGYNDVDGSANDMGAFGGPYGDWVPK